jgi:hypothetical protein
VCQPKMSASIALTIQFHNSLFFNTLLTRPCGTLVSLLPLIQENRKSETKEKQFSHLLSTLKA